MGKPLEHGEDAMQNDFFARVMAVAPDNVSEPETEVAQDEVVLGEMSDFSRRLNHLGLATSEKLEEVLKKIETMTEEHDRLHHDAHGDSHDATACVEFKATMRPLIVDALELKGQISLMRDIFENVLLLEYPKSNRTKGMDIGIRKGWKIVEVPRRNKELLDLNDLVLAFANQGGIPSAADLDLEEMFGKDLDRVAGRA